MLETITPNLEHLEIGDCDSLTREFPISLRKFTNLKSLRLENCCGNFGSFAQEVFVAIRSFKKLVVLELINIEFKDYVEEELIKCVGVRALLIIPAYISQVSVMILIYIFNSYYLIGIIIFLVCYYQLSPDRLSQETF